MPKTPVNSANNRVELNWNAIGILEPSKYNKIAVIKHWLDIYSQNGLADPAWDRLDKIEKKDRASFDEPQGRQKKSLPHSATPKTYYKFVASKWIEGMHPVSELFRTTIENSFLFMFVLHYYYDAAGVIPLPLYGVCAKSNRRQPLEKGGHYLVHLFSPDFGEISFPEPLLRRETEAILRSLNNGKLITRGITYQLTRGEAGSEAPNPMKLEYNPLSRLRAEELEKLMSDRASFDAWMEKTLIPE